MLFYNTCLIIEDHTALFIGYESEILNFVKFIQYVNNISWKILFSLLVIFIISCFILQKFYRYYEIMRHKEEKPLNNANDTEVPYWKIFKKASPQLFNIFLIFFVTLSVFPAVHSGK